MFVAAFVLSFAVAADEPPAPTPAPAPAMTTSAAPKIVRVAVMDLKLSEDIPARTGRIVADNLVAEVRKLAGVTVVSMDELRAMLEVEASRQTLGCDEKESCLAEITEALGADVVITGSVASLDGMRVLSLRRVAQQQAAVVNEVNERLVPAQGEELLAAVGPSVEKLFPELHLRPGETRGVAPEKARLLNPPPLPAWSTLVVAGAGLAALLGGVGAGLAANSEAEALQAQIDGSAAVAVQGKSLVDGQARVDGLALTANGLYVLAGAGALAAGVMALFTDWSPAARE